VGESHGARGVAEGVAGFEGGDGVRPGGLVVRLRALEHHAHRLECLPPVGEVRGGLGQVVLDPREQRLTFPDSLGEIDGGAAGLVEAGFQVLHAPPGLVSGEPGGIGARLGQAQLGLRRVQRSKQALTAVFAVPLVVVVVTS
jgi:hypothetical protein